MTKLLMLAGDGPSTRMLYHAVRSHFDIAKVIIEKPVSKRELLLRRIKRFGYWKVARQVAFQGGLVPFLRREACGRFLSIQKQHGLIDLPIPESAIVRVESINDPVARELLQSMAPDAILVNGTRIISKEMLAMTPAPFFNIHAGITPSYRGVHGGYWALAAG